MFNFLGMGEVPYTMSGIIPLDDTLRNGLETIYHKNFLNEIDGISPKEIISRKVNFLYYYQSTKTKTQFVNDTKIQSYFGTTDSKILEEYFRLINNNKNVDELAKYDSIAEIISNPKANFIKGSEIFHFQGEIAQKLYLNIIEREFPAIHLIEIALGKSRLPGSMFLANFTTDGNPITDIILKLSSKQKKAIISKMKEVGISISDESVDLLDQAFLKALDLVKQHSIDVNTVGIGTDRLTLIVPPEPLEETNRLTKITNFLVATIMENSYLNTIDEFKLSLTGVASLSSPVKSLDANGNAGLLIGELGGYPPIIQSAIDNRTFIDGFGLARIDRLGRDWNKLKTMAGDINLFTSLPSNELCSLNALDFATDDLKLAIAKNNFKVDKISDLNAVQMRIINKIIVGYVAKMENSIAQHQMIEFMRSGRWPEPKNLGIDFPLTLAVQDALSSQLLKIKNHDDLVVVEVNDKVTDFSSIILIPLKDAEGNTYRAIIDRETLFCPQNVTIGNCAIVRFGITKYLDETGTVRLFENPDLFSIKLNESQQSIFSRTPLDNDDLVTFRELQREIFIRVFLSKNQGHASNFIFGHWMPEINILSISGVDINKVNNILDGLKRDYPITFTHQRLFDVSDLKLLFTNQADPKDAYSKILEVLVPKNSNTIVRIIPDENGNLIETFPTKNYQTWTRVTGMIQYTNNFVPVREITSYSKFFRLIIPKKEHPQFFKNGKFILNGSIKTIDTNTVIKWFGNLPPAIRSSSTAGFPSPIGGLTTEIFAGQEVPIPLLELVQGIKDGKSLTFLPFRPPTGIFDDNVLLKNKPLDKKLASKFLKKFKNDEMIDRFLGSYFHEIKNFLDQDTINRLNSKYGNTCIEIALIMELKELASGNANNLVEMDFKQQFTHLKPVYVWYPPGKSHDAYDRPFSIQKLRILPGHFPTHPSDIDPTFSDTYHQGDVLFPNPSNYYSKIHLYLEALLYRILNRLTLDKALLIQNYNFWKNTRIGNKQTYRLAEVFSKKQLLELAKRTLAPGTTLVFDRNKGQIIIKNVTESRVFRYGAFRTPIFLDPKIFQNNMKIYREIIEELNIDIDPNYSKEPVLTKREIIEDIIKTLPKKETPQEINHIKKLMSKSKLGMRSLRILFEKI